MRRHGALLFAALVLGTPTRAETVISRGITKAVVRTVDHAVRRHVRGLPSESVPELLAYRASELVRGYRTVSMDKIRMDPTDPASNPSIGPSARAVATYRRALVDNRVDLRYSLPPVRLRVTPEGYMIADGHHRYLAAKTLHLEAIHGRVIE